MTPTPAPADRPRAVTAGFWCWLAGAIFTAGLGLLVFVEPVLPARVMGVFLIVVGLALGYLANRTRLGDPRFARAALGLAMATVAFMALLVFVIPNFVVIVAVIVILLIVGSALSQRPAAQAWFASRDSK